MTVIEFILARIDEEERAARAALEIDHDLWGGLSDAFGPLNLDTMPDFDVSVATIDHMRRNHPMSVLAHCSSRRMILNAVDATSSMSVTRMQIEESSPDAAAAFDRISKVIIEQLALPYFTHPDFDVEWAP